MQRLCAVQFTRQICTRDKSSIKVYADTGCRISYPEVQTIADRAAKQPGKHSMFDRELERVARTTPHLSIKVAIF